MLSVFLLFQVYQNEAAWCSSNYPFQMRKGPQHIMTNFRIFCQTYILEMEYFVTSIPYFLNKEELWKKKTSFFITELLRIVTIASNIIKRVLKIVLLSYFLSTLLLLLLLLCTLAALTLNYIIFRNVENFSKKNSSNKQRKIEGKKLNLQEYCICENENLKFK